MIASGAQRSTDRSLSTNVPSMSGFTSAGIAGSVAENSAIATSETAYTRQYGFT